jgi:hypothetical protein
MNEIEAMSAIAEKLEKLAEDERSRVLAWANAKYSGSVMSLEKPIGGAAAPSSIAPASPASSKSPSKGDAKPKPGKKAKTIIAMDKTLNLTPQGKPSAVQFAEEKAPSNSYQKAVVAVYYLRDTIELPAITVQSVFTFFKTVGWPVPADLKNTLQKAGSEGWLDTAKADDIKLTSMGENVVEHSLPAKKKDQK